MNERKKHTHTQPSTGNNLKLEKTNNNYSKVERIKWKYCVRKTCSKLTDDFVVCLGLCRSFVSECTKNRNRNMDSLKKLELWIRAAFIQWRHFLWTRACQKCIQRAIPSNYEQKMITIAFFEALKSKDIEVTIAIMAVSQQMSTCMNECSSHCALELFRKYVERASKWIFRKYSRYFKM